MVISTCEYRHRIVQFNVHTLFLPIINAFWKCAILHKLLQSLGKACWQCNSSGGSEVFRAVDTCIRPSLLMERFSFASFVQRLAGPELRVPLLGDACLDQSSGM